MGRLKKELIGVTQIDPVQRRKEAIELRRLGMSYSQIHEALRNKHGTMIPDSYSKGNVYNDIKRELDKVKMEMTETAKEVVMIELERLDEMLLVVYVAALGGNLKAMDRVFKIMDKRADLLGLRQPHKIKVDDWRSEIIQLVRDGKVSIEDVKRELGDEYYREIAESAGVSVVEGGAIEKAKRRVEEIEMARGTSPQRRRVTSSVPFGPGDDDGQQNKDNGDAGGKSGGENIDNAVVVEQRN